MWIFLENGTFYSAVNDKNDPAVKVVRMRDRRSARYFANAVNGEVVELGPKRDYAYRVFTTPERWVAFLVENAEAAKATNFKSEVGKRLGSHHHPFLDSLHDVWQVMWDFQYHSKKRSKVS